MATDYLAKKKLADALRKAQERTAALQGTPMPNTIATPGAQGGGGVYSQPEQVQANWAAPIQGLGLAFMGNRQEQKATEAEAEAEAARQAEMEAVMQQGSQSGTITPDMAIKLQNLGVDAATMKLVMPSKTNLGAVTQAARDPAGIRALVATGTWTKEQGDEALAALAADRATATQEEKDMEKYKQSVKKFAPPSPGDTDFARKLELYRTDPETYAAMYGTKGAAGGAAGARFDPAREADFNKFYVDRGRELISKHGDDMFGLKAKAAAVAEQYGAGNPSSAVPLLIGAAGRGAKSEYSKELDNMGIASAMETVAKLAPASDTDVRMLISTKAGALDSKESALAALDLLERITTRYGLVIGPGGVVQKKQEAEVDPLDAEMDALMRQ